MNITSFSADKSTVTSPGHSLICVFREACVVYVSLRSGEHMVSLVQSVEKWIMHFKGRIRTRTPTSEIG